MVNINPEAPERLDTGKYEMFTAQEHPKPPPRKVTPYAAGSGKKKNPKLNPQAPVAQKIADGVVFRRFQGEGVEFFLIGPH